MLFTPSWKAPSYGLMHVDVRQSYDKLVGRCPLKDGQKTDYQCFQCHQKTAHVGKSPAYNVRAITSQTKKRSPNITIVRISVIDVRCASDHSLFHVLERAAFKSNDV
jgi:hypothetical protein